MKNTSGLKRGGPGRPPGSENRTTKEARELAARMIEDPKYLTSLRKRLLGGRLAPAVETLLWFYAKGKPVERHEIGAPGDFTGTSDAELQERLKDALARLSAR